MAKLKYKSPISEAIHSNASSMYRAGTIDEATMREFDESCLIFPERLALLLKVTRSPERRRRWQNA